MELDTLSSIIYSWLNHSKPAIGDVHIKGPPSARMPAMPCQERHVQTKMLSHSHRLYVGGVVIKPGTKKREIGNKKRGNEEMNR